MEKINIEHTNQNSLTIENPNFLIQIVVKKDFSRHISHMRPFDIMQGVSNLLRDVEFDDPELVRLSNIYGEYSTQDVIAEGMIRKGEI